ncbi:MAG TPA: hypothetical protein VGQ81_09280, partial [Acidobacteriota bacterium]|nr:hypothetical protein [Acidobacteriota bacterium]
GGLARGVGGIALQAVEGNAPGRALELRNSVARPKKRAGLWRGKMIAGPRAPQAPPWALFLRPAKNRPGWSAFEDWENVETPGRAVGGRKRVAPGGAKRNPGI